MYRKKQNFNRIGIIHGSLCVLLALTLITCFVQNSEGADSYDKNQKRFDSPDQAVDALLVACESNDTDALLNIFGHDHEKLINTPDKAAEKANRAKFCQLAEQMKILEEQADGSMVIVIGQQLWPFPIPIVEEEEGWRFDTEAGADEIINRRIGRNELNAIVVCMSFVSAQMEYANKDRDGDEVLEYAQKLGSTKGKTDGLYWEVDMDSDQEISPFGPLVAAAGPYLEGKTPETPFMGYFFKIITKQGKNPPGGKYDYIINDNMIAGFALLAYPAEYRSSGVMTLIVNHQGKIYEKDLGKKTVKIASAINEYDPDDSWAITQQE